jgi:hypothetical protein
VNSPQFQDQRRQLDCFRSCSEYEKNPFFHR